MGFGFWVLGFWFWLGILGFEGFWGFGLFGVLGFKTPGGASVGFSLGFWGFGDFRVLGIKDLGRRARLGLITPKQEHP